MEPVHAVIIATGILMISIAAFGFASSKNLIRQLLSVEVAFNGALLLLLALLAANPSFATLFALLLISVVTGEIVVVVAILIAFYRSTKSLSSEPLEEAMV
ncbi:MAG: NADH-quinone oxidoreductase subunit K [Acidilobaceae archaeon]|nr:NADH-quinone oxidoreductase subunit K [Acidilobaceae archaeon]